MDTNSNMRCCEENYKGIVSIKDFNTYSNNYEESVDVNKLKSEILSSATNVVENYLGYSLLDQNYEDCGFGSGSKNYFTTAQPINNVNSVKVDDVEIDDNCYEIFNDRIKFNRKIALTSVVDIEYNAGYTKNRVPELFRTTILRIATLMLTETNGNIGITGKSMDGNTRTFINYTNYSKYLQPLEEYRSIRL